MNMHMASTTTASVAIMAQSAALADSESMSLSPPPPNSDRTLLPTHSTIDWFGAAVSGESDCGGTTKSFDCTRGTTSSRTCDRRVGAVHGAAYIIGTSIARGGSARIARIACIAARICTVGIAESPPGSISGSIIPGNSIPGSIPDTPGIAATCSCP